MFDSVAESVLVLRVQWDAGELVNQDDEQVLTQELIVNLREAVIIDAVRTPAGRRGGVLSQWHPADLLGRTLRHLLDRTGIDRSAIDDVIAGCVLQHEQQSSNIARHAVLSAGFPESVPAVTIDRQCGSGQQAVSFAGGLTH